MIKSDIKFTIESLLSKRTRFYSDKERTRFKNINSYTVSFTLESGTEIIYGHPKGKAGVPYTIHSLL